MARRIRLWAARDKRFVGGKTKTRVSLDEPQLLRTGDGSEVFTLPQDGGPVKGVLVLTEKLAAKLHLKPGEKLLVGSVIRLLCK